MNDILDFARPHKMDSREHEISDLIDNMFAYCKVKADEKGVVLSVHVPDEAGTVSIDRPHMIRALVNLVNNAIDASGKSDVVDNRAEAVKDSLLITIRDNGRGMDQETLENIFVPFYTKKRTGTGLGMAIANKVIEGHKGRMNIASHKGKGTEAMIKLPLDQQNNNRGVKIQ